MGILVGNRSVFFSSIYNKGATFINLEVSEGISTNQLKGGVSRVTGFDVKDIDSEIIDGELILKMDLLDTQMISTMEKTLISEFGNDLELRGYSNFGKATTYPSFYIVCIVILAVMILSIYMIIKNMRLLRDCKDSIKS
jgi:hypothetical protein